MNDDIIGLINENGEKEEFHVIATFGLDDNSYAALLPVGEDEEYIFLLRMEEDDSGETILVGIEDEDELNDAIEAYEELNEESLQ